MGQSENHKLLTGNKYTMSHFLKRTLQFVFSVSVFSLFAWYASGFFMLPQFFNVYFSTCLLSLFTHTLERKYMFLICNGILAFLAKTSLSLPSSPPTISTSDQIQFQTSNLFQTKRPPVSEENDPPEEKFGEIQEEKDYKEVASEEQENGNLFTETEGTENEGFMREREEDKEERAASGDLVRQDNKAGMAKANEELINTDELNRKFEEFIRKMKEEIRIEAQGQLVSF